MDKWVRKGRVESAARIASRTKLHSELSISLKQYPTSALSSRMTSSPQGQTIIYTYACRGGSCVGRALGGFKGWSVVPREEWRFVSTRDARQRAPVWLTDRRVETRGSQSPIPAWNRYSCPCRAWKRIRSVPHHLRMRI